MQKPIAWLIAKRRAPKSCESYRLIGGGSPLNAITRQQGAALEKALAAHGEFRVTMAMRYWQPFAADTLAELQTAGITRIVALTLYPHFSAATTGSSLEDLHYTVALLRAPFDIAEVRQFCEQPDYIASLAGKISEGLARFKTPPAVIYSAHSLPVKFIEEGDPYLDQLKQTIAVVERGLGITGRLCFQSRSGPVEWLRPSTPEMLEMLAAEGCRNVLAVPISFVSDHVETLYELDIQYRELAASLGIRLERTESLNVTPGFIKALKKLVLDACAVQGWQTS